MIFKKYIYVGIVVLLLALSAALATTGTLLMDQIEENGRQVEKISSLESNIEELNKTILNEQQNHKQLSEKRDSLYQSYLSVKRELDKKKDISVVISNPKQSEKEIQISMDLYLDDLYCTTGDTSKCKK